jgi:FixJ family two-component response regulator
MVQPTVCRRTEVAARPLVFVVDDDESMRESLPELLKELGFEARAFASAIELLASGVLKRGEYLILDVAMPGMSGPELQLELIRRGQDVPIIFITARGEDKIREEVLANGAVAYLLKPFTELELTAALAAAAQRNRQ